MGSMAALGNDGLGFAQRIDKRNLTDAEIKTLVEEFDCYLDANANDLIVNLRQDVRNEWDKIIIITGRRGVGKSTLALIICKLLDYTFNFGRLAFQPEDIMPIFQRMAVEGPWRSMQMDEGGEIWNRSDWATKVSKTITKEFIGDRWLYSFRLILAPTIWHLDSKAIDMADYWIKVYSPDNRKRGYAEVRMMTEKDYTNQKLPFAPVVLDLRFDGLPEIVSARYKRYKMEKGKERSEKYATTIQKETGTFVPETDSLDLDTIAEEVIANIEKFIDEDEYVKWRLIYGEYAKKGLGQEKAKTIASQLNKARESGWRP